MPSAEHPPLAGARRASSRRAVLTLLVVWVLAVWGLGSALERWVDGGRDTTRRNPHGTRDWLHHVRQAAPRREGELLVVLIGNSQGYGKEVSDGKSYASLLEQRLATRTAGGVRVLNWSIPGGVAPEFVLLAAATRRLDPTWVLVSTSGGNFTNDALTRHGRTLPLTGFASDVYQLAAFGDTRGSLPSSFRSRYLDSTALLDALLARSIPAWRHREIPLRLLRPAWWLDALRHQRRRQRRALGGSGRRPADSRTSADSGRSAPRRTFVLAQSATDDRRPESEPSRLRPELLTEVLDAAPSSSRTTLVLMPLRSSRTSGHPSFGPTARRTARAAGVEVWDLSTAVPDRDFVTGTHFSTDGHRLMADLLAERIGR